MNSYMLYRAVMFVAPVFCWSMAIANRWTGGGVEPMLWVILGWVMVAVYNTESRK